MSDQFKLYPLNDLVLTILLESVNASTGTKAPITTGSVTGFLATTPDSDATAYDASWSVSGVYVGGNDDGDGGTYAAGTWMFQIDAAVLTLALCDAAFSATGLAYFVVSRASDVRVYKQLTYVDKRKAVTS